MEELRTIDVVVRYSVGLGGVEIPKDVLKELDIATDKCHEVSLNDSRYPKLGDWLAETIRERDCMDWSFEVTDYKVEEK